MSGHNIFKYPFDEMYILYLSKVEKKGRTEEELNQIISWLTGYTEKEIQEKITMRCEFEQFFLSAPMPHPNRNLISGSICGVKIQEITDPMMREIRYLDKLVDELAKGKSMEKILRKKEVLS